MPCIFDPLQFTQTLCLHMPAIPTYNRSFSYATVADRPGLFLSSVPSCCLRSVVRSPVVILLVSSATYHSGSLFRFAPSADATVQLCMFSVLQAIVLLCFPSSYLISAITSACSGLLSCFHHAMHSCTSTNSYQKQNSFTKLHYTVERQVAAIQAIKAAKVGSLLSWVCLVRFSFNKKQLATPEMQFSQENLPNIPLVKNEAKLLEMKWKDKEGDDVVMQALGGIPLSVSKEMLLGHHRSSGFCFE